MFVYVDIYVEKNHLSPADIISEAIPLLYHRKQMNIFNANININKHSFNWRKSKQIVI